jgi:hypothetical protein
MPQQMEAIPASAPALYEIKRRIMGGLGFPRPGHVKFSVVDAAPARLPAATGRIRAVDTAPDEGLCTVRPRRSVPGERTRDPSIPERATRNHPPGGGWAQAVLRGDFDGRELVRRELGIAG